MELTAVTLTPVGFRGAGGGERKRSRKEEGEIMATMIPNPHSRRGKVSTVIKVGLLGPTALIATTEMV